MPPIADLIPINQRITTAYLELYEYDPRIFKFMGMAAVASATVGENMRTAPSWILLAPVQMLSEGNINIFLSIGVTFLSFIFYARRTQNENAE
jgi:hypothetical protein